MPDTSWGRRKAGVRIGTDGYGWVRRVCAALICRLSIDCALFLPARLISGGADVRQVGQVGQVRQVGHQTAAPKRLSYRSGHTALVHNRSGMLAQAAQELLYLTGIAVCRDILPTGTDCALVLPLRLIYAAVTPLRSYTAQPVNSDSPADSGWAFG